MLRHTRRNLTYVNAGKTYYETRESPALREGTQFCVQHSAKYLVIRYDKENEEDSIKINDTEEKNRFRKLCEREFFH